MQKYLNIIIAGHIDPACNIISCTMPPRVNSKAILRISSND